MKKTAAVLLLLSLSWQLCSQEASRAISSVQRIQEIAAELEAISHERERYLSELESMNEERRIELLERMNELAQREQELIELKTQLELFGDLIDSQAIYSRNLRRKLTFWRIFSGVITTSFITALAIRAAGR